MVAAGQCWDGGCVVYLSGVCWCSAAVGRQVAVTFSILCPISLHSLGFLDFGGWWLTTSGSSLSCCVCLQKRKPCKMYGKIVCYFLVVVWNCHGNSVHACTFFGNMVEVLCQNRQTSRKCWLCVISLSIFAEKCLALLQLCGITELKACTNIWKQ